jgi:cytochrome o ubiquinol oxidase subunit 2
MKTVLMASEDTGASAVLGFAPLSHGLLAPAGPVAQAQQDYLLSIIGWMLVVMVPLFIALPIIVWRYRLGKQAAYRPNWASSKSLELVIWGIPVVVTTILGVNLWRRTAALDPYRPLASAASAIEPALEIEAIGLDWKWLFIYPKEGVASLNELVVPKGRALRVHLTSGTVLQSFMIPRLGGQVYAMPGMVSRIHLQADQLGTFQGRNTQYNGDGFAGQSFAVQVVPQDAFHQWVNSVGSDQTVLDHATLANLERRGVVRERRHYARVVGDPFQDMVKGVMAGRDASHREQR